jgi:uncharacterized alpha-E superfamily protein
MQDSAPYGIPGIMDALRHGGVFMDSIPGVGILEKKVLFDHMNELCPMLMGEPLQIPQSSEELYTYDDPWPSLKDGAVSDLNYRLQLTISCFGDKVSILPGGLAFAKHPQSPKPHVKDIWVCGKEDAPYQSLMTQQTFSSQQHFGAGLPSRVADSTLWFGRYLERADCLCRLLREILVEPQRESFSSPTLETHEHLDMVHHALEIPISEEASSWQQRWSSLVSAPDLPGNLRFNLNGIQHNALVLQDRISTDMVNLAQGITKVFETPIPLERGEWLLTQTIEKCAGLTGLSIDSMTHCDEWYFLLLGRRLERATTTLALISTLLKQEGNTPVHWELLLRTFDSIMTYRWRYRIQFEPISVIELMVKDTTNPRSVIFQIQNMIQTLQSLSTKGSIWASEPCRELQETFDALLKRELHQNITGDDQPWEWLEELYQKLLNSYDKITKILHHL